MLNRRNSTQASKSRQPYFKITGKQYHLVTHFSWISLWKFVCASVQILTTYMYDNFRNHPKKAYEFWWYLKRCQLISTVTNQHWLRQCHCSEKTTSYCLTHFPLDSMAAISQTTFSDAFLWMKIVVFWLKCHWSLFLRVKLTTFQHWFR